MDTLISESLFSALATNEAAQKWTVLMTCGMAGRKTHPLGRGAVLIIAGSGKTTIAKAVEQRFPSFHRISVDEIVFQHHGIYGIDYPASNEVYDKYLDEADVCYLSRFRELLEKQQNIILERSFYARKDRDKYRELAQGAGADVILVFTRVNDKERLWERICERSKGAKTANSAFNISRDIFDMWWDGFENPTDEGHIIHEVF